MRQKLFSLAALLSTCALATSALGVELLLNKDLNVAASPVGWTQLEYVTGEPGTPISLSEQLSTGSSPNDPLTPELGGNGIELRPFFGNVGAFENQNKQINFELTKDFNITTQAVYILTADVQMGEGYSGAPGNETLDPLSPSGAVPSPTNTNITLSFLNASNMVIGTPTVYDLRTNTPIETALAGEWFTHTVTTPHSGGAAKLRIEFNALNMVDNDGDSALGDPPRDQLFKLDYFTLKRQGSGIDLIAGNDPGAENPQNGHLNLPGPPANWNLVEKFSDPGNTTPVNSASVIHFAHHDTVAQPSGQGLWLRSFAGFNDGGGSPRPVDAIMTQTAAATVGGMYSFSAWTAWEAGFSGDTSLFPTSPTDVQMTMEFLDSSNGVIGSPVVLDLFDAGMRADADGGNIEPEDWQQFTINGTAPAGAVNVRVGVAGLEMILSGASGPQSAFFDEFSLEGPAPGDPADFDADGDVDGRDFLTWQRGHGIPSGATKDQGDADGNGAVNGLDYNAWKAGFGATATPVAGAVPEPTTAAGAVALALVVFGCGRIRK
jgi:hypothetical protein